MAPQLQVKDQKVKQVFLSHDVRRLAEKMCEIGQRSWVRNFNDGNGGNLSVRVNVDKEYFLVTPTGVSKGFMTPEMMCLVDKTGTKIAWYDGWNRTSEFFSHLGIYNNVPAARAIVHAHPNHANAFAITGRQPPSCLIPEVEVFLGPIGLAPYRTPGSSESGETLGKIAVSHQAIIMTNHGVICWGTNIEDAQYKVEILDNYCAQLLLARTLPCRKTVIPPEEMEKLLTMRGGMGLPDPRIGKPIKDWYEENPWGKL